MNVITDNSAFLKINECYFKQFCIIKLNECITDNSAFLKLTECNYRQFYIFKQNECI